MLKIKMTTPISITVELASIFLISKSKLASSPTSSLGSVIPMLGSFMLNFSKKLPP
jgi:hypothetical protein